MIAASLRPRLTNRVVSATYRARQNLLRLPLLGTHIALARLLGEARRPDEALVREIRRRYGKLLDSELDNVRRGYYPASLLFTPSIGEYARAAPELFRQLPGAVRRAKNRDFRDLPPEADEPIYPDYYRRNFHWQTDGYFSTRSASVYDLQVDWLFLGATDAMRRQVIPPLALTCRASDSPTPSILDVACGTGRTLEQLAAALPMAELHGVDLSRAYTEYARRRVGDRATVTQGHAEELAYPEARFDAVTSTYLFHELPRDVRRTAMEEMHRVLKPGGVVVIEDSAQLSESAAIAASLEGFARNFHEPYYKSYIRDDLAEALTEVGFEVESSAPQFVAKVVVGRKSAA